MHEKLTVAQWRMIKGLTQKQMAEMLGMNYSTYQTKESGKRAWKADEIKNIATVLRISLENQLNY